MQDDPPQATSTFKTSENRSFPSSPSHLISSTTALKLYVPLAMNMTPTLISAFSPGCINDNVRASVPSITRFFGAMGGWTEIGLRVFG
jgi:hypothetical protein